MREKIELSIIYDTCIATTFNITTSDLSESLAHEIKDWAKAHGFEYNYRDIPILFNSLRNYNATAVTNEYGCLVMEVKSRKKKRRRKLL